MQKKLCLFLTLLSGAALQAQTPASPVAQRELKPEAYVRRWSAGATLSVLGLHLVPGRSTGSVSTSPAVDSLYTTAGATGASQRIGYGVTVQVAVSERFAVNASAFLRRLGYKMNSDIFEGTDNPNTSADERTHTVRNEDTRAKLLDFPLTVRYYGKDRHESGPRWFVQGGGAFRRVVSVRTAIDTTINDGTLSCCDTTPAQPARRTTYGVVGGAGVQLIDPVGIRVVPEIRYTRWLSPTLNSLSTLTQRNQVEAMISLTF